MELFRTDTWVKPGIRVNVTGHPIHDVAKVLICLDEERKAMLQWTDRRTWEHYRDLVAAPDEDPSGW